MPHSWRSHRDEWDSCALAFAVVLRKERGLQPHEKDIHKEGASAPGLVRVVFHHLGVPGERSCSLG